MRILILSSTVGGGHLSAAEAIKLHINNNYNKDEHDVKLIDAIEVVSHKWNKIIVNSYIFIVKYIPALFGFLYKISNKKNKINKFISCFFNKKSKKLLQVINDYKPDILISTHSFATEMASFLKSDKLIDIPLVCVLTDYEPHQTWINDEVDSYITAHDKMADKMVDMGAKKELIHDFGIPVKDEFNEKVDKNIVLQNIGASSETPVLLIMAGSFGVKDIITIYNNILKIEVDFQVIIITGNNKKLYNKFNKEIISKKRNGKLLKQTKLIMFTNEIAKYMQACDILITKPGGLTISEAMAANLPMAIFKPIRGQEEANAHFLVSNSMAIDIRDKKRQTQLMQELLQDNKKLSKMKKACIEFDKSKVNENIYNEIKRLLNKQN